MADSPESLNCFKCQISLSEGEVFSFSGNPWCEKCYFAESPNGPMGTQYKNCPKCGQDVHTFTIRCQNCQTPIHETGTIRVKKPIRSSVIMAYGILALVFVVMAFTIPGFSDKGFVSWISVFFGLIFALHGFLGLMFRFLPYYFRNLTAGPAFLVGLAESALGIFLLLWPKL